MYNTGTLIKKVQVIVLCTVTKLSFGTFLMEYYLTINNYYNIARKFA